MVVNRDDEVDEEIYKNEKEVSKKKKTRKTWDRSHSQREQESYVREQRMKGKQTVIPDDKQEVVKP